MFLANESMLVALCDTATWLGRLAKITLSPIFLQPHFIYLTGRGYETGLRFPALSTARTPKK